MLVEGEPAPCSGHAVSEGTIEQYRVTVETLAKTKTAFELAQTAWDIKRQLEGIRWPRRRRRCARRRPSSRS